MNSTKKKTIMASAFMQVLIVVAAFALMIILSYRFMSEIERGHLVNDAEDAITNTKANITADLMEPEAALGIIAENVRLMILQGADFETIHRYFINITNYMMGDDKLVSYVFGAYGVFDVFDGKFCTGIDWIPPDDYVPAERPWYKAAVDAGNKIGMTEPYLDVARGHAALTFARCIFDDNGNRLGIVSLDIMLDRISKFAVETFISEGGYGILLDRNFNVIAHPEPGYIGRPLRLMNDGPAIEEELRQGKNISERKAVDYNGQPSILFVRALDNGWYIAILTYEKEYYQGLINIAQILTALGLLLAAVLSGILLYFSSSKNAADERMQTMFDATPLCANFWDRSYKNIDCNQEAVNLFELSSKKEYNSKFFELSPEYQPDGIRSNDKAVGFVQKAFDEGYCRFEWMHRKLNGEQIPCEITLVRVKYKDDFMVAGYTRDLREYKKMMEASEHQANLLNIVNQVATVLLSSHDGTSFETSLIESFELIGKNLDVDRINLWRNEDDDGEYKLTQRFQWQSDFGKTCTSIPVGIKLPEKIRLHWKKRFALGRNINSAVCNLPKYEQDFLSQYNIKSIVIIPLFLENEFWGLFNIDDCRSERILSTEEISILSSAGLMLSIAVNRNIQNVKMREAEERTQIIFDATPLSCIMFDENFNLIECNQESVYLFKMSNKQEFIKKYNALSPEYQPCGKLSRKMYVDYLEQAFADGYNRFEWMYHDITGEEIPVEITLVRVKHRGEYGLAGYIKDLRELKALMHEIRRAELAEESNRAKTNFLARMSHEIRTPMNAIMGIAEIQLQDHSIPQLIQEAFSRIHNSGDLLLGIINDILDLSKIDAGKLELNLNPYEIASLIHDTVQLNIMRVESKPIEFILQVDENVPAKMIGDELRIKQILNNILSNAFKYTEQGMICMTVDAEHISDKKDSDVILVLRVSDTGQGMTKEQVHLLGSEYSRFNVESNRKTEGTGLGMSITRNLIELMDGIMLVESELGKGSTFTVHLNQGNAGIEILGKDLAENLSRFDKNITSHVQKTQIRHEFMPYGRVLVVDDVETNLYVARGLMAPYGLSIDIAMSGFEAIDKLKDGSIYDIVFMDHMMPKMDGIEATKLIREMGYHHPVVALTANAIAGQAEIFLKNGFDEFISKPIDIRQLNQILNKLVRDKQPSEVIEAARAQRTNLYNSGDKQGVVGSQLAEFFVRDAEKSIAIFDAIYLNKCRRADDIAMFVINIHAMKSALANINEQELSSAALHLEQAGRDRKTEIIMKELPAFINRLKELVEKVRPVEPEETEEFDPELLHKKLLEIQRAAEALDKRGAKTTLTELKEKGWPPPEKNLINTIAENLLHSEFDEIIAAISEYLQK